MAWLRTLEKLGVDPVKKSVLRLTLHSLRVLLLEISAVEKSVSASGLGLDPVNHVNPVEKISFWGDSVFLISPN